MVISKEEKEIRNLKLELRRLQDCYDNMNIDFQVNKKICIYQEEMINKLLNSLNKKEVDSNQLKERY